MSIAPRASASAAGRRRGLARRARPRAPGAGRPRGRHVVGPASSTARRRSALRVTLILDPALALIGWAHFAPPINDSFRKSYRLLLRWNDETPFVKFAVGEDERPLLIAEIPVDEPRPGVAGPRARPAARGRRPVPRARHDLAQGRRLVDRGAGGRRRTRAPAAGAVRDRAGRAAGAGGRVVVTGPRRRPGIAPGARRPLGVALVVALALAWLAPAVGALPASPAAAANTDLTLVTNATYTVQPTHGRVHVVVAIDARNHRGETRTHKYYFDHAFLAVQPGASGFAISGRQGRDRARRRAVEGRDAAADRLRRAAVRRRRPRRSSSPSTSSIPGKPVNRQVRVGTGLVTFPVWAFASDGAKGSRVQVRFPAGYDVAVESGDVRQPHQGGPTAGSRCRRSRSASRSTYFAYLTAQREAVYKASPLAVDAGDAQHRPRASAAGATTRPGPGASAACSGRRCRS